ncbi:hypothetical protein GCM10010279_27980 [Streptomyces mutabilis]|nr:hypothetical protein GCM10010279_27980 [Streptomyces mutabilis]
MGNRGAERPRDGPAVGGPVMSRGKEPFVSVNAVTHLNFRGDARAALTFYRSSSAGT